MVCTYLFNSLVRRWRFPKTLSAKSTILTRLQSMLAAVDASSVTCHQKLLFYKAGMHPWMTWPILSYELPTSWIESDEVATLYLKVWTRLTKSVNPAHFYLWVALVLHDCPPFTRLQVSHNSQLLTYSDLCVQHMAERNLQELKCFVLERRLSCGDSQG